MEPMSKEELAEKYASVEFQQKLFRLTSLSEILGSCLVANNYRPPKEFYDNIKLTAYGEEKLQLFIRKKIPYQEARLCCFLEFSWIDLLVDVEATDDSQLLKAASEQIKSRAIFFPFIFGRTLYDRAFERLDLKDYAADLNLSETLEFLDGTPQGVFQVHNMVTGPYGLLVSEQLRFDEPIREAALMHCSDVNCNKIHPVHFSTGSGALINKHRPEMTRILKRESDTPSAWGSFLADIFSRAMKPARDNPGDSIIGLLGDCLTVDELRAVTAWLLDNTRGRLRKVVEPLGMRGKAEDIVAHLHRAQLMQICLTASDRDLINSIDTLVHLGKIKVPSSEVRQPVINSTAFGKFRISAEIGPHGVRLYSNTMPLAPLRLRHLVESMYRLEDVDDREELEWQLRGQDADGLEAKLEKYLQNKSPQSVLESLVLARKSNAVTACEVLGLRDGATDGDDFISLILWKLGYPSNLTSDSHRKFWRLHGEMEKMVRAVPGSPLGPTFDEFKGAAANYFVELETVLDDSLCFAVWALTNDHFTSKRPFIYRAEDETQSSHQWLKEAADRSSDSKLEFGSHVSLYGLCRGFQVLASELVRMTARKENYKRSDGDAPEWASQQSLQKFPFLHIVPYLDLTDNARNAISARLQEISRVLVSNKVCDARNEWLHGRRDGAEFDKVKGSLDAIRAAVQTIEDSGFSRIPYAVSHETTDGYGRRIIIMGSTRGFSYSFHSPSHYDWLNMPNIGRGVHIMNSAVFSEPNHVLRFRSESPSPYGEMWSDYPRRKPRSQRAIKSIEKLTMTDE